MLTGDAAVWALPPGLVEAAERVDTQGQQLIAAADQLLRWTGAGQAAVGRADLVQALGAFLAGWQATTSATGAAASAVSKELGSRAAAFAEADR